MRKLIVVLLVLIAATAWSVARGDPAATVADIRPPAGFTRPAATNGWQQWVRSLAIKPEGSQVVDYAGRPIEPPSAPAYLLDVPLRGRFCQCADVAIMLWADYNEQQGRDEQVSFNSVSGQPMKFADFLRGVRYLCTSDGSRLRAAHNGTAVGPQYSREQAFEDYLQQVFTFAGSASLHRDLSLVDPKQLMPGDIYVQPPSSSPGRMGHVTILLDLARNAQGDPMLLTAYGWVPAMSPYIPRPGSGQGQGEWFSEQGLHQHLEPFGRGWWHRW